MTEAKRKALTLYIALSAAILLVAVGVVMLGQTFTHYNDLSLQRQDNQVQSAAKAADEHIAVQLNNFYEDLVYVLGRRGFMQAEATWAAGGGADDLIYRMQENLIAQNTQIHALLAIREGEVLLSTNGETNYTFPENREGKLTPCFSREGTMYLALVASTEYAEYAALIDLESWYAEFARITTSEGIRLMLLGGQEKLLLHQWMGETHVTAVEELNEDNCDVQAVRLMVESRNTGKGLTSSYYVTYPGESKIHEQRMAIVPLEECVNGYFIVGITSDYDEIRLPMQQAAVRLLVYASMVVAGVLLSVLLTLQMVSRDRRKEKAMQELQLKNAQTQELLEKTQKLAHHQRLETIGTLASSIAHEFNNLLTPIMGYSILTLEGLPEDCDDLAENVTEIYEASRKAKTIISRLSDLSRKNVETTFERISLEGLVRKTLEVAAPAQPAHVTTAIRCEGACCIEGNETQLSQLLLNLILNAFHAMEETGGVLEMTAETEQERVVLRVADSGTGIPEEVLPHIFEPFYTTKESGKGTGLGLAIVRQVVESHRGEMRVETSLGKGTTFILSFPTAEGETMNLNEN